MGITLINSLEILIPKRLDLRFENLRLNSKIWKLVHSCGVVKQSFWQKEMSNSEDYIFLTLRQSSFGNSFKPPTSTEFCVRRPTSHIANKDVPR